MFGQYNEKYQQHEQLVAENGRLQFEAGQANVADLSKQKVGSLLS